MGERAGHLLGIDIGGTKCALVLARHGGDILAESRIEGWTSGSPERDLKTLAEAARRLVREAGGSLEDVAAIGVGTPGPLDPHAGIVFNAPNLPGWIDVPLGPRLASALGRPVRIENDANAAALAEWRYGAGRGAASVLFLTMSTGVGGGFVLDGRLYRGTHFQAGEVGHIPIVADGRRCNCGLIGCLEAYAGGGPLAARIREEIAAGAETQILELAGGDPARISARTWIEAIRAGDAYALRLREEFLGHVAQALAILIIALDPDRVVLGTIVRENPDLFLEELRARVRARLWPSLRGVELLPGELGARLPAYASLSVAELPSAG